MLLSSLIHYDCLHVINALKSSSLLKFLASETFTLLVFLIFIFTQGIRWFLLESCLDNSLEVYENSLKPVFWFYLVFYFVPGWYDAIMFPVQECKWNFKEGDVAVISSPRPCSGLYSNLNLFLNDSLFNFFPFF